MTLPIGDLRKNSKGGFTLIEIMSVVIIMGIVLALSIPNFSKGYSYFQLNKTADDLLSISRWAQAMAIGQGRVYMLSFAADHGSYAVLRAKEEEGNFEPDDYEPANGTLGKKHTLPEGVHLGALHEWIKFYPDGNIDPSTIQLDAGPQKMVLSSTAVRGMMLRVDHE